MTDEEYEALYNNDEAMLEAGPASEFLAKMWGIKYTPESLKMLRHRGGPGPDLKMGNASGWLVKTLKGIPRPVRGRRPKNQTGVGDDALDISQRREEGTTAYQYQCRPGSRVSRGWQVPELIGA